MRPRTHVVTLAVADLDRALTFYRDGMGFPTEGLIGTEFLGDKDTPDGTTAVSQLDGGLMLSVYPRSENRSGCSPRPSADRLGRTRAAPDRGQGPAPPHASRFLATRVAIVSTAASSSLETSTRAP